MAYREPPHITVLKRWYKQLINCIAVKDVLGSLVSGGFVSMRDVERISLKCDREGQISASETLLMDVLLRNPDPAVFEHFTDALEFSNREYVAKLMRRDYNQIQAYEHNLVTRDRAQAAQRGQQREFQPEYNDYQVSRAGSAPVSGNVGSGQASGEGQQRSGQKQVTGQPAPNAQDVGASNIVTSQAQGGESTDYQNQQAAVAAGEKMALLVEGQQRMEQELRSNKQLEHPPDSPLLADRTKETFVPRVSRADLVLDLNERLGSGSFGIVFPGEFSGTRVIVKEVNLTINKRNRKKTKDELWGEYLTSEFQVSAYIRHANLALLMAYAIDKGSLFLVYERIMGHNLQQIIFEEEIEVLYRLDKKEKFFLMIQIAQALAFLHQCNPKIIHGDVKPNNMMVTQDKATAKLCDLGLNILKVKNALTTTKALSESGTPMYLAREQVLEKKKPSTRTDVWSMGASMYEVFFEEEVWPLEKSEGLMSQLGKLFEASKKPRLVEKPEERYRDMAELIGRCMHSFDENRPSALNLLQELKIQEKQYLESIK